MPTKCQGSLGLYSRSLTIFPFFSNTMRLEAEIDRSKRNAIARFRNGSEFVRSQGRVVGW